MRPLTQEQLEALELPVSALALNLRTVNALEKAGIFNVEALLSHAPEELLEIVDNFGDQSLGAVYKALSQFGFRKKRKKKVKKHGKKQIKR